MWLQLLTSKDEAAAVIKKFKMHAEAESGKKLSRIFIRTLLAGHGRPDPMGPRRRR